MAKRRSELHNLRIDLLSVFFMLAFVILIARLFQIQVLAHRKYSTDADKQYWSAQELPSVRGSVFTKDNFLLVGTQIHYLLYGEPNKIENPTEVATYLAEIMVKIRPPSCEEQTASCVTEEELFSNYYRGFHNSLSKDLMWVPLVREISPAEKEELEKYDLKHMGFQDEPVRYYPEGSLSAHVLGYVASNEKGDKTGYFGIEGALNDDLKGKQGRLNQETDASGAPILVGGYKKIDAINGRDIYLTIDRSVQYIVEKILKEYVLNTDSVSGSVIVMDPFTGEILAMANYPTYFPNDFNTMEDPIENSPHRNNIEKRNLAIQNTYEPGSVMKPITVSAAIDLGLVNPNTTFVDGGPVQYSDYVIDNWDGAHYGVQTVTQLLQKSNNIGAAWVGHQVGNDNLYKYMRNFGIGEKTGIDLEGEDTGIINDPSKWTAIDLATISFGQGISVTPLQMLNSFNALANGGFLLEPKIIHKVVSNDEEKEIPVKNIRRVISKETSDTMSDLLEQAASGGEAKYFVLKNYRIAGKTGTAQIPEEGKYSPNRTNATFVGFMAGSKRFSMITKLQEPKSSIYAAETAVPMWMDITKELVKYFGLAPDREVVLETVQETVQE